MPEYLFVYGTLRRDAAGTPHPLLASGSLFVGEALCRGRLYRIDDYPGLVASSSPTDLVRGEVYEIDEPRDLLPRLDDYEGCGPRFPRPTEFVRRSRAVWLDDNTLLAAWVYLYNRGTAGLVRIESGDFPRDGDTHPP
jgi:gamma-glutamylcyclotransferase (GGCT)/AIG2-like uncharacterized protein YtfP